jgi:hypothetical protein
MPIPVLGAGQTITAAIDSRLQAERSCDNGGTEGQAGAPAPWGDGRPMARRLDCDDAAIDRGRDSSLLTCGFLVERVTRIELALSAWEADVLPLNYTRKDLAARRGHRPDIVPDATSGRGPAQAGDRTTRPGGRPDQTAARSPEASDPRSPRGDGKLPGCCSPIATSGRKWNPAASGWTPSRQS